MGGKERCFSWAAAGTLGLAKAGWKDVSRQHHMQEGRCRKTYTEFEAVASRALDLLMFLACSRTLDLASSMEVLVLAIVERERMICVGEDAFEADETRILVAERDMLAATATEAMTWTKIDSQ